MSGSSELTKEQIIQELLLLLRQNQRKDIANDTFEMAAYIDGVEKKLDSVKGELVEVKNHGRKYKNRRTSRC